MGVRSDVSVVVATCDRRALLLNLMRSLSKCAPLPGEVVVVDDAGEMLGEGACLRGRWLFRLRVLRNTRRLGPGASRNRGVHASRGDLLLFTDDDCEPGTGWVGAFTQVFDQNHDDRLGGLGGRVRARGRDIFSRYFDFHYRGAEARSPGFPATWPHRTTRTAERGRAYTQR